MLKENTIITLDNNKKYTVLRVKQYNNKNYALITDFKEGNHVVESTRTDNELKVTFVNDPKERELLASIFLKESLAELKELKKS